MNALVLDSVSKSFYPRLGLFAWRRKPAAIRAVRQVSLAVERGDILVLLGPNGSGKSTLLKLVATMLLPDEGRVEVDGVDAVRHPEQVVRKVALAVTNERSFFPRLTARENLDFFATLEEVPAAKRACRVDEVLEISGLTSVSRRLVQSFSAGMYQRLGISRALLKNPALLLLDEPSNSLDPETASAFWTWVKQSARAGTTIALATHSFEEAASVARRVAVLRQGELAAWHAIDTGTSVEELRRCYHQDVRTADDATAMPWKVNRAASA
ncbi:MAG: ABC transporter ATP-binding protein [Acidobacteriia bacterium]|nr:ABC transporter ATP-binding protein [Terriglobia bacterium]